MLSREDLVEKFLAYLETHPTPSDYLGETPDEPESFDPYQMVGEWVALRHEVKQQGKVMQSAQEALRQALEANRVEKEQWKQQLQQAEEQAIAKAGVDLQSQKKQFARETERMLKDLLNLVDALDHAIAHWADQSLDTSLDRTLDRTLEANTPVSPRSPSIWRRLADWFASLDGEQPAVESTVAVQPTMTEILQSNRQGIDMIRRSLLDVLRQRQVVPMEAKGKPFDAKLMYAVGRQVTEEVPENTVYQEVVRGYLWGDQILREAQVIVGVRA
jgi:molecular chaperone GrpE